MVQLGRGLRLALEAAPLAGVQQFQGAAQRLPLLDPLQLRVEVADGIPGRGALRAALVLEDEPVVPEEIELTLQDLGYTVLARATSADEALRSATQQRPDLVVGPGEYNPGVPPACA